MPDEVIAAPSAGAETVSSAPDTASPTDSGAATAVVDYGSTTDAQILDGPATPARPEAGQPEAVEPGQVEKPAESAEQIATDGRAIPDKWRELFKTDPELRGLFFKERAAQQKIQELTAKHTELETATREIEEVDANFYSNDPARQEIVLRGIAEQNPAALALAARVADQILQQTQPEQFKAIAQERFKQAMVSEEFDKFFTALRDRLDANDADGLTGISKLLLSWGQKFGFAETPDQAISRRARELDARENSLKADSQKRDEAQRGAFASDTNKRMDASLADTVTKSVDQMLEKSAFSDGAKARIKKEIETAIREDWRSNAELHAKTTAILFPAGKDRPMDMSPAAAERYVQTVAQHNAAIIQGITKKIIDSYTSDFMKVQADRQAKITTAASRKDVTGGAAEARPRQSPKVDYSQMTDRQILDS